MPKKHKKFLVPAGASTGGCPCYYLLISIIVFSKTQAFKELTKNSLILIMLKNFRLTIEYDGTLYHGWQRQKDRRTIQGEIEKALKIMTKKRVVLTGSGRTDAGVHAVGQVANFHCGTKIVPEAFLKGINSLIQKDIVIRDCRLIDERFHARYDAFSKTYRYRILNRKMPAAIGSQYAWFIRKELKLDPMRRALQHIIGTHDFKAFEGTGSPRSNTVRSVIKADIFKKNTDFLIFEVTADGFLRYMVRNIVGTLVDVGTGKITPEDFKGIHLSRNRSSAGKTAPPHGLFLMHVRY